MSIKIRKGEYARFMKYLKKLNKKRDVDIYCNIHWVDWYGVYRRQVEPDYKRIEQKYLIKESCKIQEKPIVFEECYCVYL